MAENTVAEDCVRTVPDVETQDQAPQDDLLEDELLVEDVSIDGMCGVY